VKREKAAIGWACNWEIEEKICMQNVGGLIF
jgi:hypothetical protein